MAIKVQGTTVIDDSRNIINIGVATVGTLDVNKISPDGSDFGQANYVLSSGGSGGSISWQPVTSVGSGTLDGINILEEGVQVGTAGSVVNVNFVGNNVTATAVELGLTATVTLSDTPTYDSLNVSGISTFNGNTKHFDGKYANFGDSADLQIVHDGSNSVIQNATGQLFIDNNASGGDLFLRANDDVIIRVDGNDTVLTAQTGGIDVTGHIETDTLNVSGVSTFTDIVSFGSSAIFGDNDQIIIGDGPDLKLYHDGSHSYIEDSGVGNLKVLTNSFILKNALDNEFLLKATQNSSVELLYDNSKKFETTGYGVTVSGTTQTQQLNVSGLSTFQGDVRITDDDKLRFGTSSDGILQIYTNGNNSFFKQTNGDLKYELADQFIVQKDSGDEPIAIFNSDADVELYHDGSKKFETTGVGVSIVNGTSDTATIYGPSNLIIDPMPIGVGTTSGVVRIKGDLYVDGTTIQINSTTLEIADFIVGVATTATSDLLTDGAGIGIGSDKTFLYEHNGGTNPSLKSSENLNVASGKVYQIAETERLSADTLSLGTGTTIHSPGSNILTFGTNGQERVRIASDGKLSITGSTANMEYLRMGGNNDRGLRFSSSSGSSSVGVVHTINAPGDSGVQGEIVLQTNSTERLRITSGGTVQFKGDANPQAEFDRGSENNTNINLKYNGTFTGQISAANADFQLSAVGASTPISFYTNGTEKLRITSDGKVGINESNPGAKLDVNGDVSIASTVSIGTTIDIIPYNDLGALSFEGSAGQLFSITNDLTSGSIFSVNDVSGIPSIDVDADGTIQLAPYGSTEYVGIGTTNPTTKVDVVGTVKATLFSGSGASLTSLNAGNISSGTLAIARGGTNSSATPTNGGIAYGTGSAYAFTAAGTSGQVLTSSGAGAPTWADAAGGGGFSVTNDTSTNSTYYPVFVDTTSGDPTQTSVSSTKLNFNPSSGNFSATQFTSLSDKTKKTNIRPVENALEITKQLEGVRFDWIDNDKPSVGLIAQDVEKVLPELVETSGDGTKSVSYGNIIGVLIEAIKEQQKLIDKLMEK